MNHEQFLNHTELARNQKTVGTTEKNITSKLGRRNTGLFSALRSGMLAFGFNPATMQLWHEGAFGNSQQTIGGKEGVVFFFVRMDSFL